MLDLHREANGLTLASRTIRENFRIPGFHAFYDSAIFEDSTHKVGIAVSPVFSLDMILGSKKRDIGIKSLFHILNMRPKMAAFKDLKSPDVSVWDRSSPNSASGKGPEMFND